MHHSFACRQLESGRDTSSESGGGGLQALLAFARVLTNEPNTTSKGTGAEAAPAGARFV